MKSEQSKTTTLALLGRIFHRISRRRRYQFGLLFGLTLLTSLAEMASLSAVVPFIGILTQPERVLKAPQLSGIINVVGITNASELLLPIAVVFTIAAIVAGGLRLALLWASTRLTNATGQDLSVEAYTRTLYQTYSVHVARNSSDIVSGITQKVATATSVLTSLVTVITSAVIFLAILATLIAIDPFVASVAFISFGSSYILIAWKTRRRLSRNSREIALQQTNVVKAVQEGLGAIRDVLLDGTQQVYRNIYEKSVQQLQAATGENQYITLAPRYVMETIGMILIGVFGYFVSGQQGGITAAMPALAAVALGAQRLLPLLQQLYGNWAFVVGSKGSLDVVVTLLEQPLPGDADSPALTPLPLNVSIRFDNVSFRYSDSGAWILNGANLIIRKGSQVGFVGSTGSGKSTAVDLLMCLLEPTHGGIMVDEQVVNEKLRRAWQLSIAHVPQSIYLVDATIAENIAFGIPFEQIDMERIYRAARKAHIADFIECQPNGYNTVVGERGVRLSGGQRQRIGIARALFKEASVLIFDEATSALDSETENSVMQAIESLESRLTVILIAHRIQTLKGCDQIIELGANGTARTVTYESLIANAAIDSNRRV